MTIDTAYIPSSPPVVVVAQVSSDGQTLVVVCEGLAEVVVDDLEVPQALVHTAQGQQHVQGHVREIWREYGQINNDTHITNK
jgi:hypothetical protein